MLLLAHEESVVRQPLPRLLLALSQSTFWRITVKRLALVAFAFSGLMSGFAAAQAVDQSTALVPGDSFRFIRSGYYGNNAAPFTLTLKEISANGDQVFIYRSEGSPDSENLYDSAGNPKKTVTAEFAPNNPMIDADALAAGKTWSSAKFTQKSADGTKERVRTVNSVKEGEHVLADTKQALKAYRVKADNKWVTAQRPAPEEYTYCPTIKMVCSYKAKDFDLSFELIGIVRASQASAKVGAVSTETAPKQ